MTPSDLVEAILNEEGAERVQGLMNQAYKRWQAGGDLENTPREDFYGKLEDPHRLAVVFGNLNYQVENGGWSQWIYNNYADPAIPYIREYAQQYGSEYPTIAKVAGMVARILELYEDAGGEDKWDSLEDWLNKAGNTDELADAINNEDWNEVYDILGGTDLDERHYRRAKEETYRNGQNVDTYESGGRWGFRLEYESNNGNGEAVIHDSGAIYASEDEADEAGNEFAAPDLDDVDTDVRDAVEQDTKDDLIEEYGRHMGKFGEQELDRMSSEYYKFNADLLKDLEKLVNDKFPNGPIDKALDALKKGWAKASAAVNKAVQPVKDKVVRPVQQFAQRVGDAGRAAAKAFRGSPSSQHPNPNREGRRESVDTARSMVDQMFG
jgi:hypothetical protein